VSLDRALLHSVNQDAKCRHHTGLEFLGKAFSLDAHALDVSQEAEVRICSQRRKGSAAFDFRRSVELPPEAAEVKIKDGLREQRGLCLTIDCAAGAQELRQGGIPHPVDVGLCARECDEASALVVEQVLVDAETKLSGQPQEVMWRNVPVSFRGSRQVDLCLCMVGGCLVVQARYEC